MVRPDDERLAAALRVNLRKRKAQTRGTATPEPSNGTDEEGDVIAPDDARDHPGAWVQDISEMR